MEGGTGSERKGWRRPDLSSRTPRHNSSTFFKASSENPYLVRFLLEHQPLLGKVYGAKGSKGDLPELLSETGFLDAYLVAGQSYLESEHYDLSSLYFLRARKLHPRHPVLQSLLSLSHGMDAYYRNDYPKALSYFSKLTRSLGRMGNLKRSF